MLVGHLYQPIPIFLAVGGRFSRRQHQMVCTSTGVEVVTGSGMQRVSSYKGIISGPAFESH